jgi:hypothetical protein
MCIYQTMVYVVDGHPSHVESEIMGIYGTPDWQRGRWVQMGCNVLQCEV